MLKQFAVLTRDCQTQTRFFGIRVCQPGLDTAVIQEGCEEKHRGGEEADKKEVIHYRMRPMSHSTGR